MSTMAWYPLPQSGSALSAGDEFFDNQSVGWSLWSFSSPSDHHTTAAAAAYSVRHENDGDAAATRSQEQSVPALVEPQPADDIFLSQFSDEEMQRMDDAPFEALDMFPDSMHRLLTYENMLSGVLTGGSSEDQDAELGRDGVDMDTMDTCGFPLFSHDLQDAAPGSGEETPADSLSMDKAVGTGTMKRSRSFADDDEGAGGFEALVLEELEDVVFQLTKKTRICFRDAFFRLAECSSKAGGAVEAGGSRRQSVQQAAQGSAPSRVPTAAGCPERETNAIDRTVADLTMRPPCAAPLQVHGSSCAGGSGPPAAQSTTTWAARA